MRASDLVERYGVDRSAARTLAAYGFDAERFDKLRGRLARLQHSDRDGRDANWVLGTIEAPAAHDLTRLPPSGTAERERLAETGCGAIAGGRVGVLLLAGGMATRFGGGVKALAEVLPGLTFAAAKLADLRLHSRLTGTPRHTTPIDHENAYYSQSGMADQAATHKKQSLSNPV